ncbi:hypothetical protein [Terricaulis sp.]|uniref:hypothetical protein n=1 Tax=Terricaulis sp. TaxID=2768686 RepID=UPI002AC3776D|nr:hypothetical protein [Terricaulis sp.]MDZ4689852.1 hypothetical protein [Terricaulis sp.]
MAAWFKPKRYGLGASPSSWQGWALTIAYVIAIAAAGMTLMPNDAGEPRLLPFLTITVVLTILFVGIAWRTTEGGWHWRWGEKD